MDRQYFGVLEIFVQFIIIISSLLSICNFNSTARMEEQRPTCRLCKMTFSKTSNLKRHLGNIHGQATEKRVKKERKCSVCGFEFTALSNLYRHMRRQHGEDPVAKKPLYSEQEDRLIDSSDEDEIRYQEYRYLRRRLHDRSKSEEDRRFDSILQRQRAKLHSLKGLPVRVREQRNVNHYSDSSTDEE